jgi:flagellar biosynthesis protein FlhF
MPTHTFIADSANEAVAQIRGELGPSAVVLSVRKLPRNGLSRLVKKERIEVVATVEGSTDIQPRSPVSEMQNEIRALKEQFAAARRAGWGEPPAAPQTPEMSNTKRLGRSLAPPSEVEDSDFAHLLTLSGILPHFASQVLREVPRALRTDRSAHLDCIKNILRSKFRGESIQNEAAVHLFIGVPGSGKSTVLCKMLAQTSILEQQPATVYQLDSHLANSCGQTAIFAEIIGANFQRTLPQSFERREESVFIDIPGVALGDEKGLRAIRSIAEAFGIPEIHLVLNGAYESTHLIDQARFFANVGISDLILTHLDEESRWGKAWNLILGTNYSIRYLSCGQNVPGDLLPATAEALLTRQFRGK